MEIILGIALIAVVAWYFTKKKDVTEANDAPYKVDTPVPAGDIAPQPVTVVEGVPSTVAIVEGAGAVEIPAAAPAKKTRAKKPAAATTAPKKPRAKKAKAQ